MQLACSKHRITHLFKAFTISIPFSAQTTTGTKTSGIVVRPVIYALKENFTGEENERVG